jgi:lipopolysaccharide export system protein LptC
MAAPNTYSRVVAWVKVILPLMALGLLSTLFLFSRTPDPNRAIPFAEVDVEELAREQRLGNPRIAGTLPDGRAVIFTADRAAPALTNPSTITASGVQARVDLAPDTILLIGADEALFNLRGEAADLTGDVQLTTSNGYRLTTGALHVDLAGSAIDAPGEVQLSGPGIELTAGAMRLSTVDGHDVALFNGGVRMLYDPGN